MDIYDFSRKLNECKGTDKTLVLTDGGQNIVIDWTEDSWVLYGMSKNIIVLFDRISCQGSKYGDLIFKGTVVANIDVSKMEVVE